MSGGFFSGRRGGRREFQTDLNLVPFIDLFSTIIIFLLSVAVWDQLASVPINLGAQDKAATQVPKEPIKKVNSQVKITVRTESIEVFDEGKVLSFPKQEGKDFDFTGLEEWVAVVREKYVDKKDMLIFATDTALYEELVGVMDRCLAQNFSEIVVTGLEQGT